MSEVGQLSLLPLALLLVGCSQTETSPSLPPGQSAGKKSDEPTAQPRLEILSPIQSIGEFVRPFADVSAAKDSEVRFVLKNAGDGVLQIRELIANCACAKLSIASNEVPPGGSTTLNASVSLFGGSGRSNATIRFLTNDRQQPFGVVRIEWQVTEPIAAEPIEISLQETSERLEGFVDLYLLDARNPSPKVERAVALDPHFTVDWKPASGSNAKGLNGRTLLGRLCVEGSIREDEGRSGVKLKIMGTDFHIPMSWPPPRGVQIAPATVFIGTGKPNASVRRKFILRANQIGHLRLHGIQSNAVLGAVLEGTSDSSRETIISADVAFRFPESTGPFEEFIRFDLEADGKPSTRRIRVVGIVSKQSPP